MLLLEKIQRIPAKKSRQFALFLILLCGFILRVAALNDPISYDEAYTYQAFASQPLFVLLTDYHLPNNHIFHSLLVHFSALIFGNHLWILRLPALLAGMGLIWATYLFGNRLYAPEVGLASAALTAISPEAIMHATRARGYSLVALLTLLIFYLGLQVLTRKKWFLWLGIAILSALGFWTIPIMFFPFGILFLWLILESFSNDIFPAYAKRWEFFRYWLITGILSAIGTLILYFPVLRVSGTRYLLGNVYIAPAESGVYANILGERLLETANFWIKGLPTFLVILLVFGFFLGILFHRKLALVQIPFQLAAFLWMTAVIILRRPNAYSRFWSFLLAPMLIFSVAGLLGWGKQAQGHARLRWLNSLLSILLLGGMIIHTAQTIPTISTRWIEPNNAEAASEWLVERLEEGDMVLIGYPHNPSIWYYLGARGIPHGYWEARTDFTRAYLLTTNQSLEKLVHTYQLDATDFDLPNAIQVKNFGKIKIFLAYPPKLP